MASFICFHTSSASRRVLNPNNCTASSMEYGNGGLPGVYFMSVADKHFQKDPPMYRKFCASREKHYGKFMHQFTLNSNRPHFSMDKLTITKSTFEKMNKTNQFTSDTDKLWYELVEYKKVRTDHEFLSRLIFSTGIKDVKFWVKCISAVADYIIFDESNDIPGDGVAFVEVRPEIIITI